MNTSGPVSGRSLVGRVAQSGSLNVQNQAKSNWQAGSADESLASARIKWLIAALMLAALAWWVHDSIGCDHPVAAMARVSRAN